MQKKDWSFHKYYKISVPHKSFAEQKSLLVSYPGVEILLVDTSKGGAGHIIQDDDWLNSPPPSVSHHLHFRFLRAFNCFPFRLFTSYVRIYSMFLGACVGTYFRIMLLNASVVCLIVHIFGVSLSITWFWLWHGSSTEPEEETGPEMHTTLITAICNQWTYNSNNTSLYSTGTILTTLVLRGHQPNKTRRSSFERWKLLHKRSCTDIDLFGEWSTSFAINTKCFFRTSKFLLFSFLYCFDMEIRLKYAND